MVAGRVAVCDSCHALSIPLNGDGAILVFVRAIRSSARARSWDWGSRKRCSRALSRQLRIRRTTATPPTRAPKCRGSPHQAGSRRPRRRSRARDRRRGQAPRARHRPSRRAQAPRARRHRSRGKRRARSRMRSRSHPSRWETDTALLSVLFQRVPAAHKKRTLE